MIFISYNNKVDIKSRLCEYRIFYEYRNKYRNKLILNIYEFLVSIDAIYLYATYKNKIYINNNHVINQKSELKAFMF